MQASMTGLARCAAAIAILLAPVPRAGAQEVRLTAMTLFFANDQGVVNPLGRWNTLFLDAAWDIGIFEGTVPPDSPVPWLNDLDRLGINIPLSPGDERTFGFVVSGVPAGYYGLNLFFDGGQEIGSGVAGISAFTFTDVDGPGDPPPFIEIPATSNTMGWPIADIPGAGTLQYRNGDNGIKVTLTDLVVYVPEALFVDLVQAQDVPGVVTGRKLTDAVDGVFDLLGQFTLKVETYPLPPGDLVCTRSADGRTTDLSWTLRAAYDSLKVFRDGTEIASLPVDAVSYQDRNVPALTHTYEVIATAGPEIGGPRCTVTDPAHPEVYLTALTLFGANAQGAVNPSYRWNTFYLDAAWDIAVFEGAAPPAVPVAWINDNPTYGVNLVLQAGEERTFGFCVSGRDVPPGFYGLNIFFEGAQDPGPGTPGISVVAATDNDGPGAPPPFAAIAANVATMGWPIPDVLGSGSLVYLNEAKGVQVVLTDFIVYSPDALLLDVAQPQEPGGLRVTGGTDFYPDLFGQFTLRVGVYEKPPTELACTRSLDGKTANLSWKVNGRYDSLRILRDGVEIASISPDAASFQDAGAPPLAHLYELAYEANGAPGVLGCKLLDPANPEVFLSALTFFGTTNKGQRRFTEGWNTLYLDPSWDVAVHDGPLVLDPAGYDPSTFWLNRHDDMGIEISLQPGEERTFSFYLPRAAIKPDDYFGLNLFFDAADRLTPGALGISVFALADVDGPDIDVPPAFQANGNNLTMGWPSASIKGSNSLVYTNCDLGIQVTLTDYVAYPQSALNGGAGIDLVQKQEPGGLRSIDGQDLEPDFAGQFTLRVEVHDCNPPPSDLTCTRSADGKTVDVAWTVNSAYESLKVFRDGSEIASLPVSAVSYQDTDVPIGTRTYQVIARVAGKEGGPSCTVEDPAHPEIWITALTLYGTTEAGFVRIEERWNTLYPDPAWDIAVHEGAVVTDPAQYDPSDPGFWLNSHDDMSVRIPLLAGQERTFALYMGRLALDPNWFGLNIFFDGAESPPGGTAGISVFAPTDGDGPDIGDSPPFAPNFATPTMGWPIADIPGAGTLVYEDQEKLLRISLTDFAVYPQSAINGGAGIDLVQQQESGTLLSIEAPDGLPDFVARFTLKVESISIIKEPEFRRGDAEGSGVVDLSDPIFTLTYLFVGGDAPKCKDAADSDDSGVLDLSDAIFTLGYLFLGGDAPPAPGPKTCGKDQKPDVFPDCEYTACK